MVYNWFKLVLGFPFLKSIVSGIFSQRDFLIPYKSCSTDVFNDVSGLMFEE